MITQVVKLPGSLSQTIAAEAAPQAKIKVQMKGIAGSKNSHFGLSKRFVQEISRGLIKALPSAIKKVMDPIIIQDAFILTPWLSLLVVGWHCLPYFNRCQVNQ